jgi:DNA mismatch repair protein MutL
MNQIKVMSTILANKIAAGEVVEKISSVVKELVENSIDANSTEIKIELVESGIKEIKVTDNGTGMNKEDAVLAFERHATSKLISEADLFNINTLGFRGEALPSIASVSKTTLKTSEGDIGTIVTYDGGHLISVENGDSRKGTVITVKNLFFNTPARLKHMKSLYSELANVSDFINKIALSHPNIKFTLINDDNVLLNTDGSNNLLKVIKEVYGTEVARKMIPVKKDNNDYEVEGFISLPEVNKSSRSGIVTIVNGRVVKNMEINRYINDAYHGYKPDNRYPVVVLNIKADPILVDVNVHPTKMDIKFSNLEDLGYTIDRMIKDALRPKDLTKEAEIRLPINDDIITRPIYEELTLELDREIKEEQIVYNSEKRLKELYPIGLIHGTYIVCQNDEGMYLVDQHAAKERINYEFYKNKLGNPKKEYIDTLVPYIIELTNDEFIIIKENMKLLSDLNFLINEFGINSLIIKGHPNWLPKGYEEIATKKVIETIIQHEKNFSIEKFNEALAIMMSCKLSIKANLNISLKEMEQLINDLRKCDNPFNCPHGRPTVVHFSNYDLEKLFKRSGF